MRFNNIQLLRVAAATAVAVTHLSMHAHLVGVDATGLRHIVLEGFSVPLLFAVSGFVLAHVLQTSRLRQYVAARVLRLYPGYWLALLAVVGLMRLRVYSEHHRWLIYFVNLNEITLAPVGPGQCQYLLNGVEWSLIYEFFLSMALAVLSLFGPRRGMPLAVCAWLAIIVVKVAVWRGHAFQNFPHWSTLALSAYCIPFLLGVLVYYSRDYAKRWRWLVLAAVVVLVGDVSERVTDREFHWCVLGLAAAGMVWFSVNVRDLSSKNWLVRAGDWTYGLYLLHVPLILAVYYTAARTGWVGRVEVLWLAAATALIGGLCFGRIESALHARIRPLAKLRVSDIVMRWQWLKTRVLRLGMRTAKV